MDNTTAQTPRVSKSKRGGYGCAFFFCLMFLLGGAIPALLNLPGLQARFTGMETTALVSANVSCSWEDSDHNFITDYYYTYTFTVSSGKVYQITDTSCGNNPDVIGARETIWYQPANPTHFLTANAWTFDWLFFLGFSIPMLLFAYAFLRGLLRRLFAPSRRLPEVQRGFSPDIYMTSMAGINPVAVRREERPEMEAIRQALLSGDRIQAITLYRSVYGGSLREAEAALGLLPPFR